MGQTSFSGPLYVAGVEIVDSDGEIVADIDLGTSDTLQITSTAAGATGAVIEGFQDSASPAADDSVAIFRGRGDDSAGNEQVYAQMAINIEATTSGSEEGSVLFSAASSGTGALQEVAVLYHDNSNAILGVGDGAAAGIIESEGSFDLTLRTGNATTGTISITDGADGDITIAPNGTGNVAVGGGAAAGVLESNGSFDLQLQTGNATTGTVTLTDGADGDLTVALNGAGTVAVTGSGGLTVAAQSLTPNNDNGAASTVNPGVTSVDVGAVTNDANDWITLPALASVPNGHEITILCNAGGNFEMRTPTTSNEEINSEDCDGTKEYLCTDTEVIKVVKINNTIGWMAHAYSAIGAVVAAVVPDA